MIKDKKFYLSALALALPSILQQLVTNLSQMADNLMVGHLAETSIAGVAITNQIFFIFLIVTFGFGAVGGIFITQYKGANKLDKVTEVFRVEIIFAFCWGLLFFLILNFFPENVLGLLVKNDATVQEGLQYVSFIKYTFLLYPISLMIGSAYRFLGHVKLAMYVAFITVIIGIFLNWVFIYGNLGMPAMGVKGAALGTLIMRIIELSIFIVLTLKLATPIKLHILKVFSFGKEIVKNYIDKAVALIANEFFWALGFQINVIFYTKRISENIAAYSIANVMISLIFIGMGGLSIAISIKLGNSLGQNKFERAKRDSKKLLKLAAGIGLSLGVIVLIASFFITGLYNIDQETLNMTRGLVFVAVFYSWLYYLDSGYFFTIRMGGDTRSVLIMDSGFVWIVVLPLNFLASQFALYMPIHYLMIQSLDVFKMLVARHRYHKDNWMKNLTVKNDEDSKYEIS